MSIIHFDRGAIATPTSRIVEGRAARLHKPGDGLRYPEGDEYRDEIELNSIADQLARGIVVCWDHQGRPVGITTGARVDGDHVVVTMQLDDDIRDAIKTGRKELSLGYECRLDEARYQRGIQIFELAIVEVARCGASCAIRIDCAGPKTERQLADELRDRLANAWRGDGGSPCSCTGKK